MQRQNDLQYKYYTDMPITALVSGTDPIPDLFTRIKKNNKKKKQF